MYNWIDPKYSYKHQTHLSNANLSFFIRKLHPTSAAGMRGCSRYSVWGPTRAQRLSKPASVDLLLCACLILRPANPQNAFGSALGKTIRICGLSLCARISQKCFW
jgi:hypothetical protein